MLNMLLVLLASKTGWSGSKKHGFSIDFHENWIEIPFTFSVYCILLLHP